jgi:hypothetical protein
MDGSNCTVQDIPSALVTRRARRGFTSTESVSGVYNPPMSNSNGNALHYRILPPAEWFRLEPIFKEKNWFLPPAFLATACVAENSKGEIIAFQILQSVLHAEPTFIQEEYRGMVNYLNLWEPLKALPKKGNTLLAPGFLLVAPDDKIKRMAELGGFSEIPGTLMKMEW